ncbi:MAG: ABC transporter permease [Acetobacteraceae bacterium]|nr:ABC transporter permease [Acetobacteraceae bacterium]
MLAVTLLAFGLMYMSGDPVALLLPVGATPQEAQLIRHELGLDRPFYVQFALFLADLFRGDLGTSIRHGQPALPLVVERLPATITLTLVTLALALACAIPMGLYSALFKGRPLDAGCTMISLVGQCVPLFWLGIELINLFAVRLHLLPAAGWGSPAHLVLPVVALGAYVAALFTRLLRSSVLEILTQDYVRTARAKGLSGRIVLYKHVLRNSLIPLVNMIGVQTGVLMSGAIITEQVFGIPGMGRLALEAVANRDFPTVRAFVMVTGLLVAVVNLTVDLTCSLLDPRIRRR